MRMVLDIRVQICHRVARNYRTGSPVLSLVLTLGLTGNVSTETWLMQHLLLGQGPRVSCRK